MKCESSNLKRMHLVYIWMKNQSETKNNYKFTQRNKEFNVKTITIISSFNINCSILYQIKSNCSSKSQKKHRTHLYTPNTVTLPCVTPVYRKESSARAAKTRGHPNIRPRSRGYWIISRLSRPWPEPNHQYFYCEPTPVKRKRGAGGRRRPLRFPSSLFFARVTAAKGGRRRLSDILRTLWRGRHHATRTPLEDPVLRRIAPASGEKPRVASLPRVRPD